MTPKSLGSNNLARTAFVAKDVNCRTVLLNINAIPLFNNFSFKFNLIEAK